MKIFYMTVFLFTYFLSAKDEIVLISMDGINIPIVHKTTPKIIYYDDMHRDEDGVLISLVLEMHKAGLINILGIITEGIDTRNRKIEGLSAIIKYHKLDIPIGVAQSPGQRRIDSAFSNIDSEKTSTLYHRYHTSLQDFPNDGCGKDYNIPCGNRYTSNELIGKILTDNKGRNDISITIGGTTVAINEFLEYNDIYNGKELLRKNIKNIFFIGRDKYYYSGQSTLGGRENGEAVRSVQNIIKNMPENIKLILSHPHIPYYNNKGKYRIGQELLTYNQYSPMAFVLGNSVYHDGLKDGIDLIDMFAPFLVAFGENYFGSLERITLIPNNRTVKIIKKSNKLHYQVQGNVELMYSTLKKFFSKMIKKDFQAISYL